MRAPFLFQSNGRTSDSLERGLMSGRHPADYPDMSAAEAHYGRTVVSSENAARPAKSTVIPLLVFFVALAVVTLWFVGRPVLTAPSTAARSCERVIVQESGSATCVTGTDRVVRVG